MSTFPQWVEAAGEASAKPAIVIVEDDVSNATMLTLTLRLETSYDVRAFRQGTDLLAHLDEIKANPPVLFIFDYVLPNNMTGVDLYDHLNTVEECATVPALLLTATAPLTVEELIADRPISVINKPFDIDNFLVTIHRLIKDIPSV
ncbi:MAG TPA: response regulator [Ktedonobacteraceae bacterium]|nr:response regulator [Ktedonobacteraceae bacterium]